MGWWLLLFVIPVAILVAYSFGETNLITFQVEFGWTLDNYALITDSVYLVPIARSVVMALGTTLGCLLIGFPVAYYISTRSGRAQKLLLMAIIVPVWISFVVRAYAWIGLLRNNGPVQDALNGVGITDGPLNFLYTPGSIALVMVYGYLPLMILPLYATLERLDRSLLDAAADLGASGFRTLWRVIVPHAKPGIYAGCLLVGVPAIGEFTIPYMLGGGKTLMLGNVIADQFREVGDYSVGAAFASTLTVAVVVIVVILRRRTADAVRAT